MSDRTPRDGRSVLVVDDDFILAMDARDALEDMGLAVVGPFSGVDLALASLQENRPDVAVVDLNLGSGPSFDLVRALTAQAVPTLMVTGYDKNIIPHDLASVPYLQKPIAMSQLVSLVDQLLSPV
jgi:DNA-binding response OmpR family regulator